MGNSDKKEKSSKNHQQTLKEVEDQKAAKKKAQERKDDIALVIGLLVIMVITVSCVVVKIMFFTEKENLNISTFKPLKQQVNSDDKYTDVGYIPCNGYVPCKTDQMSPEMVAERMEGADPCHDYKDGGPGPDGCW